MSAKAPTLLAAPPAGYTPPKTDEERLADPFWRLNNIYAGVDEDGKRYTFKMRPQQLDFYWRMWYLNIILKSRQHGFTTLCCLLGLDRAAFIPHYHCHFIQQTKDDSYDTFEKKIKFPYEDMVKNFPELRDEFNVDVDTDNNRILKLKNGSSISTGTSGRGSTIQLLHVSEHAKICATQPQKAKEIRSGSLNTVHPKNYVIIESTAEGRSGDFYTECMNAKAMQDAQIKLTLLDFKFFFYPWYTDAKNALDPRTLGKRFPEEEAYFEKLRNEEGVLLTPGQKTWYIKKKQQQRDLMFREHPTTPEEAFQGQVERKTYGKILMALRRNGAIQPFLPYEPRVVVNTTWDLGKNDENAIWLHQYIRHLGVHRWLQYYESHGHGLQHYVTYLKELQGKHGFIYGNHFLPHDVMVSEFTMAKGETRLDYLEELGLKGCIAVERVPHLADGIDATRRVLEISQFSEEGCREGLIHLEEYEAFEYDEVKESARDTPSRHKHSNAADAIRQLSQEWETTVAYRRRKHKQKERRWRVL